VFAKDFVEVFFFHLFTLVCSCIVHVRNFNRIPRDVKTLLLLFTLPA